MGVDQANVSSMEQGQQNVTLLTIWSAAQALGVRPAALFEENLEIGADTTAKAPRRGRTKA